MEKVGSARRVCAVLALVAVSVWLGGLVALGAIAAPVVFSVVPLPASADAMTVVFRRFDQVAVSCAAVALGLEGVRAMLRLPLSRFDLARAVSCALATAFALIQAELISPRIANLHFAGVARGIGDGGRELSQLHDWAERCGQAELWLLVAFIGLQVVTLAPPALPAADGR